MPVGGPYVVPGSPLLVKYGWSRIDQGVSNWAVLSTKGDRGPSPAGAEGDEAMVPACL